jgi:hypothetical protein
MMDGLAQWPFEHHRGADTVNLEGELATLRAGAIIAW